MAQMASSRWPQGSLLACSLGTPLSLHAVSEDWGLEVTVQDRAE